MSRARLLPLALLLVLGAAAHGLARAAQAKPPVERPADEDKPLDFEPIVPAEANEKAPPASDWVNAQRVRITRMGPRAAGCRAWRARSWLKIHCDVQTTAVALLGGASDGAFFWLPQPKAGEPAPPAGEVVFPMRPGDRRVFELFSFGETYGGSMVSPGLVLQEYWLSGENAPTIVLR